MNRMGFPPQMKLYFLAVLIYFAGCAAFRAKPVADLSKITPAHILERVQSSAERIRTLRGRGRLIVEMPGAQFAGRASIYIKKPDSLFIIAKALLGVEVGFFFADRERFQSYSPIENAFYTGPVDKMHQLILFEMEIPYEQLLSAVLGTVAIELPVDSARVSVMDNQYVMAWPKGRNWLVYKIAPGTFVVTEVLLIGPDKSVLARQSFSRFRKIQGVWLPKMIRLQRPPTRERLTIWYESIEINKPIAASEFQFNIPPTAKRINLNGKQEE